MWTRAELKKRAKAVLKNIYWRAFGVGLVIMIAGGLDSGYGGASGGSNNGNNGQNGQDGFVGNFNLNDYMNPDFFLFLGIFIAAFFIVLFLVLSIRIFLGYPLEVGGKRFFVKASQYEDLDSCFSFAFKRENYKHIVVTMLVKDIYNFLWFLLLIIPGIVKGYAYRMVPYILTNNPSIGTSRAIQLSNEMTRGHKFSMFVLDLSFIGWYLLGLLALVIGILFVIPYEIATKAELYIVLRNGAIESGLSNSEELRMNTPEVNEI